MQKKVRDHISSCHMLEEGGQVIATMSGGADPVYLLHPFAGLRKELHIGVSAVHVHRGVCGEEADRGASFTEEFYRSLGVPCLMVHKDAPGYAVRHSMSPEETGRYLRYGAFGEEARRLGGAKTAATHHSGDQAETVLRNLLRSSSLKGLGGMEPVRSGTVQPLLTCNWEEILDYLGQNGLTYCGDSTNAGGNHTRNRLRNVIIPQLVSEISHGAVEHTICTGDMIGQADVYVKKATVRELEVHGQWEEERAGVGTNALKELGGTVGNYVIIEMITRLGDSSKDIASRHVALVRELLDKGAGARLNLPYALVARRGHTKLWIEYENKSTPVDGIPEIPLLTPVFTALEREKHQKFPEDEYMKWFDYDKIKGALSVRARQTRNYITSEDGKRKTVKSYMTDKKIEREPRDGIPPLTEGNHVLWIVGYWISEYYKIAEEMKRIP